MRPICQKVNKTEVLFSKALMCQDTRIQWSSLVNTETESPESLLPMNYKDHCVRLQNNGKIGKKSFYVHL